MVSRINTINGVLVLFLLAGLAGTSYEAYQYQKIQRINTTLQSGQVLKDDKYPLHSKLSAAYFQGSKDDYKHAVQSFGQALEIQSKSGNLDVVLQGRIQYNIGTNLFLFGLTRNFNEDGSLNEEAKYSLNQAKVAFEQSLRLNPEDRRAKFNLSLLNSVTPNNMKNAPKDQSGVELSNLPIGLP